MDIIFLWSGRKTERKKSRPDIPKLAWYYHQATMLLGTHTALTTRSHALLLNINNCSEHQHQTKSFSGYNGPRQRQECFIIMSMNIVQITQMTNIPLSWLIWCYCFFVNYRFSWTPIFPPRLNLLRYPVMELLQFSDSTQSTANSCFLSSTEIYHLRQAQIICFLIDRECILPYCKKQSTLGVILVLFAWKALKDWMI